MLTRVALLRHSTKGMYHKGNRQLHTLISYVLLIIAMEGIVWGEQTCTHMHTPA